MSRAEPAPTVPRATGPSTGDGGRSVSLHGGGGDAIRMITKELHRPEPSTDFPTMEEVRPCPESRVTRALLVGVATAAALVGVIVGFLLGRSL